MVATVAVRAILYNKNIIIVSLNVNIHLLSCCSGSVSLKTSGVFVRIFVAWTFLAENPLKHFMINDPYRETPLQSSLMGGLD